MYIKAYCYAAVSEIKAIHIYDFDNTCELRRASSSVTNLMNIVFHSPLPNQKLWTGQTIGMLQSLEVFVNGSWWHDLNILGATGLGIEKEEPRAWEGWWNEQIVR